MSVDLSTNYLGHTLRNPIIASSSGLTDSVEKIKKLYDAGIGAVVLKSIFEEQILREIDSLAVNNMYGTFQDAENYVSFYTREHNLNNYIQLIQDAKKAVPVPIIASISCLSDSEWINYAQRIESAGADALELNMFIMPSDPEFDGQKIETEYLKIIEHVTSKVSIPVSIKLGSYFSGMADFLIKLSQTDIKGMVLFNRFYTPDIDLETEKVTSGHIFSAPVENGHVLRWVSILSGRVSCHLTASTGIYSGEAALKNLLAGAKAVQVASVLYEKGIGHIGEMLHEMEQWLEKKNYASIKEIIGKLSTQNMKKPMVYERAQFMKYYSNHY
jgi:dihydroorotate dehydrogenase (fumarate)